MVLVQPMGIDCLYILMGKLFAEIELRSELTKAIDHGTLYASIGINHVIGKGSIDVLVDHIKNNSYSYLMTGIDQAFQSLYATSTLVGREVVQRPIAPVKVQLQTGDRQ
jgi:hypothetical protein